MFNTNRTSIESHADRTMSVIPKKSFWNLSRKLLIPSMAVIAVIALGLITYIAIFTVQRNQSETTRDLTRTISAIETNIEDLQVLALGLATEMANTPQVQEAFAAHDRELLTKLTLPTFEITQKEFEVKQFQFILPPSTSFLRLHQLDNYGDDLSAFRFTVLEANATQAPVSGIEIGRGGLGVRGEVPVFYQGNYIGVVDVGLDIGPAYLEKIKKQYGVEVQLLLEKRAAETATFAGATSETTGPTTDLLLQASTFETPLFANPAAYERVLKGESVVSRFTSNNKTYSAISVPLKDYSGQVIGVLEIYLDRTEIISSQFQSLSLSILLSLVAASLGGFILARFINLALKPIDTLTETATALTSGDLERRAEVQSKDELGILANAFNNMTGRLRELIGSLEIRVADRTRNLELAAEVGRAVSQVRDLNEMLKDACDLILKDFNLYYVQVYLTNTSGSILKLEAGTGTVGAQLLERNHSLPLNTGSINGRAAVEQCPVVIPDTALSATFRQNPLLPNTRGEVAVPLIVANKVVGVLDMQSSEPGVLNEEVLPAFEALAGQMAVAIQNANLLAETKQARTQVEAQARRLVREGWGEYLDAIHKPEQLGFVFDHNKVIPFADTVESQLPKDGKSISAPIAVTGESLGSLVVELNDETRHEQTSELVNLVAHQVAQQIENLRLLETAERFRVRAEQAARYLTREGWQEYFQTRQDQKLGYVYDLKQVKPMNGENHLFDAAVNLPVKVRDEMIGKLSVQGVTQDDQESVELANAVADRLGAHIENLRLFEETRLGQMELDKRARQLAAVAEISNVSSKELDIQKMLESVVFLTQRKFGLYHAHIFLYDDKSKELKIVACGWKEGDEHEGTHGTTVVQIEQEQSLVARAARTRQAVIVNDVHNEPGWLPNPLLPDTASELAVPLVVGDRVLGVLDVQSDSMDAFTEEDANIQTTLASQVATALQNAHSFAQAQRQAEREAMLNTINQKIQSATSVEAVLQIAARELGHALGAPMTIAQLSMKDTNP